MPSLPTSLQTRLALTMVLLILGSLWGFALWLADRQEGRLRELLAAQQMAAANDLVDDIDKAVRLRLAALDQVAIGLPRQLLADPEALTATLSGYPVLATLFDAGVVVRRADGKGAVGDRPTLADQPGDGVEASDAFRQVLRHGRPAVGKPWRGGARRQPQVAFATPLRAVDGRIAAVVMGFSTLDAPQFLDLAGRQSAEGSRFLVLAPRHGIFVTATDRSHALEPLPPPGRDRIHDRAMAGYEGSDVATGGNGVEELASVRRVASTDWLVMARLPADQAFAAVRETRWLILAVAGVLSLLAGLLAVVMIRRAMNPLAVAARELDAISRGQTPLHGLPVAGQDEVGRLLASFNRLQEQLQAESSALQRSEANFRLIFEAAPLGILHFDGAGRLVGCNDALVNILGSERAALLGLDILSLPNRKVVLAVREALAGRPGRFEGSYRSVTSGKTCELRALFAPLRAADGKMLGGLGIVEDIGDRNRAAADLRKSERRFRVAFRASPVAAAIASLASGRLLETNARFERDFGWSAAEAGGRSASELGLWADGSTRARWLEDLRQRGTGCEFEAVWINRQGRRRLVSLSAEIIELDNEACVLAFAIDITERQQAANALQQSLREFNNLVVRIPVGVFKLRVDGHGDRRFDYVSPRWCELLELSADAVYANGQVAFERFEDADMAALEGLFQPGREGAAAFTWEGRLRDCGRIRWVHVEATPTRLDAGGVLWEGIQYEVTERRLADERLRLAASVFENSHEGVMITDAAATIIDVNAAFTEITGYPREEVLGRNPRLLNSHRHEPEFYANLWRKIAEQGFWRGELWNRRRDGSLYPESLTISAVRDGEGAVCHYVGVFSNIAHIKEHQAQLEQIAHYDPLTGVPNRLLLADRMRQAIAQTHRNGKMMAVGYLDLDGFKPVNDYFGHAAGDQVLVETTRRLKACLRAGDTVARLGGDEFVLLLLGLDRLAEYETAVDRILNAIAQPYALDSKMVTLSASIGVTLFPHDDGDPETLLRHADKAMYAAKQRGRDRHHLFDPDTN